MGYDESKDIVGAIDYAAARAPGLPIYLMGVSMGGATVIYAAGRDPRVRKLVIFDPVLDPHVTTLDGLYAILGWPRRLLIPVRWSAETFFPGDPGHHEPLTVAKGLHLPVLLIEDDADPVCPPQIAYDLAKTNPHIALYVVHDPKPNDPGMQEGGRWGGHAAAFRFHPALVERRLARFLDGTLR
jgi:dienelactone hydrolase